MNQYTDAAFEFEIHAASLLKTKEFTTNEQGIRVPMFERIIILTEIDAYLNADGWEEDSKARLLEDRASAYAAFTNGDFELALAKMAYVYQACKYAFDRRATHNKAVEFKHYAALKESKLKAKHSKKP